jgi:hypothetical protein
MTFVGMSFLVELQGPTKKRMKKTNPHKWTFTARFRRNAFGWKGSRLACQGIKEAVSEIKKVTRKDPFLGAEGAIKFTEKLWPALQHVDSSSGALGTAVYNALGVLVDIVIEAPVDEKTRSKWLDRLWEAFNDDGVGLPGQRAQIRSGCRNGIPLPNCIQLNLIRYGSLQLIVP